MQSLFDACASKMTHKEYTELEALPAPNTVTDFLLVAKNARNYSEFRYEQNLGGVADQCFVFGQYGDIVAADTLANIENSDQLQGFRFNCAFGKKEQLAVIWQKLSDEDKAALRDDCLFVVQYYSTQLSGETAPLQLYFDSFSETLDMNWLEATLNIYDDGKVADQKYGLFFTWMAALVAKKDHLKNELYQVLRLMNEEREFSYGDDEREELKMILRENMKGTTRVIALPGVLTVREFHELALEVESEMNQ